MKLDPGEGFDCAESCVWGKHVMKGTQMGFVQSQAILASFGKEHSEKLFGINQNCLTEKNHLFLAVLSCLIKVD